jgi:hypothetical protein
MRREIVTQEAEMTLPPDDDVRLAIYRDFADSGVPPSVDALAVRFGVDRGQIEGAIRRLVESRHLVYDAEGTLVLAHPFATRDFGFSVMGRRTLWWGGCAWDAFAIPHLVPDEPEALVATTCPACGTAHAWTVTTAAAPAGDQVAHFLTPMMHVWDDVVHACENQRIFCNADCVETWLERTGNARGAVFDLPTLWRLASGWYAGRLDPGYRRREPKEAAEYFASVGLVGEFWGTPKA